MPVLTKEQQKEGEKMKPIPHYPYWHYLCPKCGDYWESELYHNSYCVACPDCREVLDA